MKYLRSFLLFLSAAFIITSCQKELSFEDGAARGTLKKANGDCLPGTFSGNFKADTLLNATNFVDIQVDIAQTGTYVIKTDTLNGYSFSATGIIAVEGLNTIRLLASGRPVIANLDMFTVKFDTTSCKIGIIVTTGGGGGGTVAKYTFVGSPTTCTGAVQTQNFYVGIPTNATNYVDVKVDVQSAGTYTITTPLINGVLFTATGSLAVGTNQNVRLVADGGTPTAAGTTFNYALANSTSNCGFNLTVQAAPLPATYTFNCATANVQGTFQVNSAMTATNKITVDLNVATGGSYNITSTMNGVTFSKAGVLPATPAVQTITLDATGTAGATVGLVNFTLVGGGGPNCSVPVTFTAAPTPAAFTFNCTSAVVVGTYQANTAMTAANKITIDINVTAGGPYTITGTMNGVTFSKNGTLSATPAVQTITLDATGTAGAAVGPVIFSLAGGGGTSCSVPVTFTAAPATNGTITFKIGTVIKTFNFINSADTSLITLPAPAPPGNYYDLFLSGNAAASPSQEAFTLELIKAAPYFTNVTTYTVNQLLQSIILDATYTDNTGDDYTVGTDGSTQTPAFSVTITSITPTRVTGTFTGPLTNATGTVITADQGTFDLPLQ